MALREESGQQPLHRESRPALVADIGSALVTKAGSLFVLCEPNGDIDAGGNSGHGLYFHDTRHLDVCRMRIDGHELSTLLYEADGPSSVSELTNPDIQLLSGTEIRKDRLAVRRERTLGDSMVESVELFNFCSQRFDVTLSYEFDATFANMFVVRGAQAGRRGRLLEPEWNAGRLAFRYQGADGRERSTVVTFDPKPDSTDGCSAEFRLELDPGRGATVVLTAEIEDAGPGELERRPARIPTRKPLEMVKVETDNALFDRVLERSFKDLQMLVTRERGEVFFAAGVPWYVALFGRDSLITSLQTLAFDPSIASTTLRLLAKYQGREHDEWRDEEPGKILHELRVGEMANLREIPQTPYYGSVDATPLFVVVMAEYVRWTGDFDLWRELKPHVMQAVEWINNLSDHDGDGFADYMTTSTKGSRNQGWKDSSNSIVNRDGSLGEPPIALVEVQGYVYRALRDAAWLLRHDGDSEQAQELEAKSQQLKERFRRAFWMPEYGYFAVAMQQGRRPVETITSNPGQALWSGIAEADDAAAVAAILTQDRMFSGWGIRTLASGEPGYNPIDYQVGAIWPHDNSLIAAGLKRYGHTSECLQVFSALFEAAARFQHYRLPEVFAGFAREKYAMPVRYPVACNPQAWAAASIPYLLHTCLGLAADAAGQRLEVVRPALPSWLNDVTVRGLKVGDATVDLRYQRSGGETLVGLAGRQGDVQLVVIY